MHRRTQSRVTDRVVCPRVSYLPRFKELAFQCITTFFSTVLQHQTQTILPQSDWAGFRALHVRSSPARLLKFDDGVEKEKIGCEKKVSLDVDIRWNSTYLMLETAIRYEKAFRRLHREDNYMSYFVDDNKDEFEVNTRKRKRKQKVVGAPCEEDWTNASVGSSEETEICGVVLEKTLRK